MRPPSRPWLLAAGVRTEAGGPLVYGLWWLGDGDGGVATLASCSLNTHSPPYQPHGGIRGGGHSGGLIIADQFAHLLIV